MSSKQNVFETLNKVDVSGYTKKKGKFSYLSWCFAVQELLKVCPEATWDVHIFKGHDGADQPYMKNGTGAYVQVTVNVNGILRTQVHPVLDNRNAAIKEPDSFQINTSIQRCLAKAIALHGLGLYIFAGEDLPEPDALTKGETENMVNLAKGITDKETREGVSDALSKGTVNSGNYELSMNHIKNIIKEQKKVQVKEKKDE